MLPWIGHKKNTLQTTYVVIFALWVVFVFLGLFFLNTTSVFADSGDTFGVQPVQENIALSSTDIRVIIAKIIRAVLGLLGFITLILVLYAGFTIMTSGGNEEKVTRGKKTLINAVIGLAIIMSALAIVQFVINALTDGGKQEAPDGSGPPILTFEGSGALGRVVKDHYPFRNETGVPRNTKIAVTFFEQIQVVPSSIIVDYNNNGTFGDCLSQEVLSARTPAETFDWKLHCDRINTSSVHIYRSSTSTEAGGQREYVEATARTVDGQTYVFKPIEPLGDEADFIWYTVDLLGKRTIEGQDVGIQKNDGAGGQVSVFQGLSSNHYAWEFQTDNKFDSTPPHVVAVSPANNAVGIKRNKIVQVYFNEAIDPITVQGTVSSTSNFTNILINLTSSTIDQITASTIVNTTKVEGKWQISNGYKTLSFIPAHQCGLNNCGDPMYCLDLTCAEDDYDCSNRFHILMRTARLNEPGGTSFQADGFTGIVDMADNALDGDNDRTPDGQPPLSDNWKKISISEQVPDNYTWDFGIINQIERESPYIVKVLPRIDEQDVNEHDPLMLYFNSEMWVDTLSKISLDEYPAGINDVEPPWFSPSSTLMSSQLWSSVLTGANAVSSTVVEIRHRQFGPNDTDLYYFTKTPSDVLSSYQNCFYPGWGPWKASRDTDSNPECVITFNDEGEKVNDNGSCVLTNFVNSTDTGCLYTPSEAASDSDNLKTDIPQCVQTLEDESVSPY